MALCGSYAPLSIDAARAVITDRPVYLVLAELVAHADPRGICWPGLKRLAAMTHYSTGTVQKALQRLMELDYLRFHVTIDPLRRHKIVTYQVSPYVMYIREELESDVLALWGSAKKSVNAMSKLSVNVEPELEPAVGNQNQNQIENQTAPRNGDTTGDDPWDMAKTSQDGAQDAQNSPIGQDSAQAQKTAPEGAQAQNDIPLAAAPLAAWLAVNFRTRPEQAAALIDAHGAAKVWNAIQSVRAMPSIKNPYGKLKRMLEPVELSPIEQAIRERSRNRG